MNRAAVTIRRAKPEDAAACGQICFDAFRKINSDHNFPPDIASPEMAVRVMTHLFSDSRFYCVVAELDGRIAGSNCLDERDAIGGVGPITIDPDGQNRGIGRKLMDAVLERARERNCAGVRLVQAAFHNRSLSLYTTLGFDVREPLSVMQGPAIQRSYEGFSVRPATEADLDACNQLALRVYGHHRGGELADAIRQGTATLVERNRRITGYTSSLGFYGHSVAETNPDLQAIIGSSGAFGGPGILLPSHNSELFRWCLANGLRVVEPMTLMSLGLYNEPKGAFLPSILY
jgi:predicted N-acetyltransferase YhbS